MRSTWIKMKYKKDMSFHRENVYVNFFVMFYTYNLLQSSASGRSVEFSSEEREHSALGQCKKIGLRMTGEQGIRIEQRRK